MTYLSSLPSRPPLAFPALFPAVFVGALAVVGVLSHPGLDSVRSHSPLTGEAQALYEEEFEAGNPLRAAAISFWTTLRNAAFGEVATGALAGRDGWIFTAEEWEAGPDFDANLTTHLDEIAAVANRLNAAGITLAPVIVPDKARVHADKTRLRRPDAVEGRYQAALNGLRARGVDVIDARPVLMMPDMAGSAFLATDTHWSPQGAEAVAGAVAAWAAHLPLTRTGVETVELPSTNLTGDLAAYAPGGLFGGHFAPADETIRRFETTAEATGGLLGDAVIEVALVGTSFSAKQEWHFAGFLSQALGTDLLNVSEVGRGPFEPMQAYLASADFEDTKPRLVIWEIPERYLTRK